MVRIFRAWEETERLSNPSFAPSGENLTVVGTIALFANCGEQDDRTTIAAQVKGRFLLRKFAINPAIFAHLELSHLYTFSP